VGDDYDEGDDKDDEVVVVVGIVVSVGVVTAAAVVLLLMETVMVLQACQQLRLFSCTYQSECSFYIDAWVRHKTIKALA
jgi:hypothetical protein